MTGELVYSPGYQLPLWLGPAQLRLWRRIDRLVGDRTHAATTVRELAGALGANPGSVSRDLDRLASLGFAVHLAAWGRRGLRLWRVASRGGRRGLDPSRRRRALARMGLSVAGAPGQLVLAIAAEDPGSGRPARSPQGPADDHPPRSSAGAAAGPFRTVTCQCGRSRIVADGVEPSPCPHPPDRRTLWESDR